MTHTTITHPRSAIPSTNSFLLNSHCVAALNFHATTNMLMLAGSRVRSSQNCWIPSMPILFSSWGSAKIERKCHQTTEQAAPLTNVTCMNPTAHLYICYRAVPASCDLLNFSWTLCSKGLDSGSSYPLRLLVSSHSVIGSTQQFSLLPAWRTWTAEPCLSVMTLTCAAGTIQTKDHRVNTKHLDWVQRSCETYFHIPQQWKCTVYSILFFFFLKTIAKQPLKCGTPFDMDSNVFDDRQCWLNIYLFIQRASRHMKRMKEFQKPQHNVPVICTIVPLC